jgi:hypothetical protein
MSYLKLTQFYIYVSKYLARGEFLPKTIQTNKTSKTLFSEKFKMIKTIHETYLLERKVKNFFVQEVIYYLELTPFHRRSQQT